MQKKPTKQSKAANTEELRFLAWCKEHPSIVSGYYGVEVHHCAGSSAKTHVGIVRVNIGHWFCLPLTTQEHWLYHNRKREFQDLYGTQVELWLKLIETYPGSIPDDVIKGVAECGL
jgi:hypothetical protein